MKYLAITMMLFSSINLFGQVRNFNDIPKDILNQLDKMGVDGSSLLNSYESAYFNIVFKENLNGFDFTGKKEKLIRYIEDNSLEKDLKEIVNDVWNEIEAACKVKRKNKYE